MAAGGEGYFHASYFHDEYWHDDYWAEDSPAITNLPPIAMAIHMGLRIGSWIVGVFYGIG